MGKQQSFDVEMVPRDLLRPGPGNFRDGDGWPPADADLAASIKAVGILEPLIVRRATRPSGLVYEVIAGHRRVAAAGLAGLEQIPVFVRELTDTKALQVALIENLQREDLSPIEEARGLRQLLDTGMPQTTAAKEIGRTQAHVSKRLSLLKLPPAAQAYLDAGKLRIEDGLALARLDEAKVGRALYEIERLQFRRAGEVEQLIQRMAGVKAGGRAKRGEAEAAEGRTSKDQTWELTARDLVVFRELARKRLTLDGARQRLTRSAALRELEWNPKDLADLLKLAIGDTRARRRGRPAKGGKR